MIWLSALLVAGAFLFLHTGERADGVCERERFVPADGVSLWPPGARCTFGEPARTDVLLNPWLGLVLVTVVAGGAVGLGQRSTRGRSSSRPTDEFLVAAGSQSPSAPSTTPRGAHQLPLSPVIVSLPTADRRTSFAFYGEGLGFDAIGEPADDGVPEPLQFALNDGLRLMLIPTGGFGWVIGDREVAGRGQSECMLNVRAGTEADVDALVERAHRAGGEIVTQPGQQPWGYAGAFADPDGHVWMVTAETFPA